MSKGKVYLVGAGPGDPGLLTVRGLELLRQAEVVVYDYLANPALLQEVRPGTELIFAGKRDGQHTMSQERINAVLVEQAQAGKQVIRLKGGDPFVFGRGGEEAQALRRAGIAYEVVPGVSSAVAVPAYAGIPVTHRQFNNTFTVIAGQENLFAETPEVQARWEGLAKIGGTLVFLMGVKYLAAIGERLVTAGLSAQTPVACIRWGTLPHQQSVSGTLENIVARVAEAGLTPPAVIVVGGVVSLSAELNWFEPPAGEDEAEMGKLSEICQE